MRPTIGGRERWLIRRIRYAAAQDAVSFTEEARLSDEGDGLTFAIDDGDKRVLDDAAIDRDHERDLWNGLPASEYEIQHVGGKVISIRPDRQPVQVTGGHLRWLPRPFTVRVEGGAVARDPGCTELQSGWKTKIPGWH